MRLRRVARGMANLPQVHTRRSGSNDGKSTGPSGPHQPPMRCPECTSQRVWKDGIRYTRHGEVQRYICSCGFRFSESTKPKKQLDVFAKPLEGFKSGTDLADGRIRNADFSLEKREDDFPLPLREDVTSHTPRRNTECASRKAR